MTKQGLTKGSFVGLGILCWGVLLSGSLHAEEKKEPSLPKTPEVEVIKGISYYKGKDADSYRHQLDLYLPKGKKDFPVLFFIHGGAWRHGNKNHFGIYAPLGKMFARNGIAMVSINYRLSPAVMHPVHIQDVARAFAWTYKNIGKYGGRTTEIFVAGHSAGGHLSALLATDERYLKAQGLTLKTIRGAIPMSGVFLLTKSIAFTPVFGEDKETLRQASPLTHAKKEVPPFLIVYADSDLPGCGRKVAQVFHKTLTNNGAQSQILEVEKRNHLTVLLLARQETDPVAREMLSFIMSHVVMDRLLNRDSTGLDVLGRFVLSGKNISVPKGQSK